MEIKIVNCTTGEEVIRNATKDEIANLQKSQADGQARKIEAEATALAKAALLDRLGITADEAKLLLS
jgi:hypothetical protein